MPAESIIHSIPFKNHLSDSEFSLLENAARQVHFHKGQIINRSAEECLGMLMLSSGQIRVYFLSDEGKEITLFRLRRGEVCILSASCLLESITFDVIVEAIEDTDSILLPSHALHTVMEKNPYVELYFAKLANERFSDAMWVMQQIMFKGADQRVAAFLWDEMAANNSPVITYTHEEIAGLIGSAREVVSRAIKTLAMEGVLSSSRGKITILDRQKLREHC